MNIPNILTLIRYSGKVIVVFLGHTLLFAIDGRMFRLEQYLPLHLGEWLCRLLLPGLIIDGETGYDVDVLDSWIFWGLLLLPLCFFLWGRNVTIGYLCLWIPVLAALVFAISIENCQL